MYKLRKNPSGDTLSILVPTKVVASDADEILVKDVVIRGLPRELFNLSNTSKVDAAKVMGTCHEVIAKGATRCESGVKGEGYMYVVVSDLRPEEKVREEPSIPLHNISLPSLRGK